MNNQKYKARVFICHQRYAEPDEKLAIYLHKVLTDQGHQVFVDRAMQSGDTWLQEIDDQIKASDFFVVLLSRASVDSEMVQAEVHRAYDYRKQYGHPYTLPVRMAYEGLLPYTLAAFAIDEADRLLSTPFYSDFFALIRSWYNASAYDDLWQKLTIVLVISTEPFLLISDLNQSPFNVGLKVYLNDFDETQVWDLNQRHGTPVHEREASTNGVVRRTPIPHTQSAIHNGHRRHGWVYAL
jgi:hypothetical protein